MQELFDFSPLLFDISFCLEIVEIQFVLIPILGTKSFFQSSLITHYLCLRMSFSQALQRYDPNIKNKTTNEVT